MLKKLPPYGERVNVALKNNQIRNDIYLYCGTKAWQITENNHKTQFALCLPAYVSPFIYQWPVNKCDVLICDTGYCEDDYVKEIVAALFSYDANIVRYISPDGSLTVFKKDF